MSGTASDAAERRAALPSPAQIRGARGMLGWSMRDLATAAQVSVSTVKRMKTAGPQPVSDVVHARVRSALKAAGLRLLADEESGHGLWLRDA